MDHRWWISRASRYGQTLQAFFLPPLFREHSLSFSVVARMAETTVSDKFRKAVYGDTAAAAAKALGAQTLKRNVSQSTL